MKKLIKNFVLVLMIAVAAFSITACGKTQPPETPPGPSDPVDPTPGGPDFSKPDPDANFVMERDGDYVYLGRYASTIKPQNVQVAETPDENGYYKGTDGGKYVKVHVNQGLYYNYSHKAFSDGTSFEIKQDYDFYFKVEKLKWKILKQDGGKALVRCATIVDSVAFQPYASTNENGAKTLLTQNMSEEYKTYLDGIDSKDETKTLSQVRPDDWEYSYIRYFLNEYFYNTAFTDEQKALIVQAEVDNSLDTINTSTYYNHGQEGSYVYNKTNDNLFLLSYKEMLNSEYGFSESDEESETRVAKNTDYAIAKGSYNYDTENSGWYWLRSYGRVTSGNQMASATVATNEGVIDGSLSVTFEGAAGVLPSMWIKLEAE